MLVQLKAGEEEPEGESGRAEGDARLALARARDAGSPSVATPDGLSAASGGEPAAVDPLARARAAGSEVRRRLLEAEGGVCPGAELAQLLGVSPRNVEDMRRARKLIAVRTPEGEWLYPVWQVRDGRVLEGIERLVAIMWEDADLMRLGFVLSPNDALWQQRPLDLLRRGEIAPVLEAAELATISNV